MLNCGNGNAVTQVACEMLCRTTGADVASVPYRGNSQSMADLAAGQIAIAFSAMSAAGPFASSDAARHMLAMPEWEKHRIATGGMKLSGDRVESEAFVRDELARWERYVKETGVKGTQ